MNTETGVIQPPYAIGEICVKSLGVIKSYINKSITEEELDKEGFWHMGDLGYYDVDGNLYYSSRAKDIMKYKGQQVIMANISRL